ncbi:MAG TPA: hypothetical protein VHS29_14590, partial [Candidatus Acidoferrales bacterium]|nr:hypothetical protein [Candidatus Acidoferrales bacterium]
YCLLAKRGPDFHPALQGEVLAFNSFEPSSVVSVCVKPLCVPVTVTVAPPTALLVWSVTVPLILPALLWGRLYPFPSCL